MLSQENFAVIDLETTGPISEENYVIDIGIVRVEKGKITQTYSSLVKPPIPIPPSITHLTGIRDEDVKTAPRFKDIIKEIEPFFENAIFTAHNAAFDYGYLSLEYLRMGRRFIKPVLCTKNLAHVALPELPKLGLDALMEHFGITADQRHRAFPDADITARVLLKLLKNKNISQMIQNVLIKKEDNPIQIPEKLLFETLPTKAGVYQFLDVKGNVLYIGSADNVRSSALIHFVAQMENKKERELCKRTKKIQASSHSNELEARIAEALQIRELKPKYNRLLKNWYPGAYLWVSTEEFPQLLIEDEPTKDAGFDCHGPYDSRRLVEKLVEFAAGNFHLCDFRIGRLRKMRRYPGRKSCLGIRVKRCLGACLGKVPSKTYQESVKEAIQFLRTPLGSSFLEDEAFVKVLNNRKTEKITGGWKSRRLLKRLLKASAGVPASHKKPFLLEEIGADGNKTIFLISKGLLIKSWLVDSEVTDEALREDVLEALKIRPPKKDARSEALERLAVGHYVAAPKAYRRIIKLNLLASR